MIYDYVVCISYPDSGSLSNQLIWVAVTILIMFIGGPDMLSLFI